jgi:hypothetical protein
MADWSEFFKTDDFRAYRRHQAEVIAGLIYQQVKLAVAGRPEALSLLAGRLDVANEFLRLPENLTDDRATRELLDQQLTEDIVDITRMLVKREVLGE